VLVDEIASSDSKARYPSPRFDVWEYLDSDPVRELGCAFELSRNFDVITSEPIQSF
jgi:hypothetical protein